MPSCPSIPPSQDSSVSEVWLVLSLLYRVSIDHFVVPVVQGGMQWYFEASFPSFYVTNDMNSRVGYAELASAVSNAGGLGIVRYALETAFGC